MKHEDDSVHIGNHNKISNSVIGSKNHVHFSCNQPKKTIEKLIWQFAIPIAVVVIAAVICHIIDIPA